MVDSKKAKIPKWASEHFKNFLDQSKRLDDVLHLTLQGISMVRGMPRLAEAVVKATETEEEADQPETTEERERIEETRRLAELAEREVDSDFPLVHGQALIALWALLEALVRGFVAEWIRRVPESLKVKQVAKIRIPLAEYQRLSEDERYYFIADQLDRDTSAPLKRGVNRFETLLDPFGLSGAVDSQVRRDLYELSEIRNVLVHRAGIIDVRLLNSCPWLNLTAGNPVSVSHEQYVRAHKAVGSYVLSLLVRVGEHFGVNMDEFKPGGPSA